MEIKLNRELIPGYYPEKYSKDQTCGCEVGSPHKEDCYFYSTVQDMGADISCCNLHKELGNCPCKNCTKFLDESDAFKIIRDYVNKEEKKNEI